MVVGDVDTTFAAPNPSTIVRENLSAGRADGVRWRVELIAANERYEGVLAKATGWLV